MIEILLFVSFIYSSMVFTYRLTVQYNVCSTCTVIIDDDSEAVVVQVLADGK
jgi:hypothetical protein